MKYYTTFLFIPGQDNLNTSIETYALSQARVHLRLSFSSRSRSWLHQPARRHPRKPAPRPLYRRTRHPNRKAKFNRNEKKKSWPYTILHKCERDKYTKNLYKCEKDKVITFALSAREIGTCKHLNEWKKDRAILFHVSTREIGIYKTSMSATELNLRFYQYTRKRCL